MTSLLPHHTSGGISQAASASPESPRTDQPPLPEPDPLRAGRVLRRNLRASTVDGAMFSVMVGAGETYLPAFVLALGLGEITSGWVMSIPMLSGAILQMLSPWAVRQLRSNRLWVLISILAQAASFIPMILAAVQGRSTWLFIFACTTLYWGAGLAAGPAWNTWMETLVPRRVRAPFFAWRSRISQAGLLLGFVVGGAALQYGKAHQQILAAFALLFSLACVCRFISAYFISRHSEVPYDIRNDLNVTWRQFFNRMRPGNSEQMLLGFLAIQVAVQISGPFFSPYLLRQMKVSYIDFMVLIAISFVGKIVAFRFWGWVAGRYGVRILLWIGVLGIMPLAGMWVYTQTFWPIFVLQFFAGALWAAYELAMFLLFFETVRCDERTSMLTMFNLANSVALVAGTLLGTTILWALDKSPEAYRVLFVSSTVVRVFTLILLRWINPPDVWETRKDIAEKATAILPETTKVSTTAE